MNLKAYTLFDRKALAYSPPFFTGTDGLAVRMVTEIARDTNTTVGRHPADYVLYCVGEFHDHNGALVPMSPLVHVVDVITLLPAHPVLPFEKAAQ